MINNNMRKKLKNKNGFSLVELIVSVTIFSMLILATTSIFQNALKGQMNSVASQNTQESMRYAFEVISKEVRTAVKSEDDCECLFDPATPSPRAAYKVYNYDNDTETFYFKNKNSECVGYTLKNNRLTIVRDDWVNDDCADDATEAYLTPDEISVTNLKFQISDDEINAFHSTQPVITLKMDVEMAKGRDIYKHGMTIQTSISSRYYE